MGTLRAYPDYQDELRILISHRFLSLDKSLKQTVETAKNQVAKIFKEKGNLNVLSESEGSDFFVEMANLIPERCKKLKEGFEIITNFQLSYRGLILPRVRHHLDGLTNISAMAGNHGNVEETEDQTLAISVNTTAEEIFTALEIDYEKAINRLKPALEELLCEPNEAAYAMVEEFVDNVIRQKGIQIEWKNFLRGGGIRGKIWAEIFGQKERDRQIRKEWLDFTNKVENLNKLDLFSFI
jgi:hypothetical protein